jgi:hypothetical protein
MTEGVPRAKNTLAELVDTEGNSPKYTWLLRADYQIKRIYGDYNHILSSNYEFLKGLEEDGDELGWHPHFWDFDEKGNIWFQNKEDVNWQLEMLDESYRAYQDIFPGRGKTVRAGWAYHNNETMRKLSALGVRIELSAMPGIKIEPKSPAISANYFDWEISPRNPYSPSIADFRRPALDDEQDLSILEVPNFVAKSTFWGIFGGIILSIKMRDPRQVKRAIVNRTYISTITSKPKLFKPMLRQIKRDLKKKDKVFYVSPLHPDELISNVHPVYSLENMVVNLSSILKLGRRIGASVKYIRAEDVVNYI